MTKIKKHIQIVRSTITELSSMSKRSCDAIYATLSSQYQTVGVTIVNSHLDLAALIDKKPDLVFVGMKYVPGVKSDTKIWLSEFLTQHDIPHTGSPQQAIDYELNKPLAKIQVHQAGVATARYVRVPRGQSLFGRNLDVEFPLFVKPAALGGGQGVDEDSYVSNTNQLHAKVAALMTSYNVDVLVEEYLSGREFSVAVLRNRGADTFMTMPIEIAAPDGQGEDAVLSQDVKTANNEIILAVTDPIMYSRVTELALTAFHAIGGRDYGRIDIKLDGAGVPHFLEANLIPSLISGYGSFPKACALNVSMDYPAMINHITDLALNR